MKLDSLIVQDPKLETTTDPHVLPIFATSSFRFEDINQGVSIFNGEKEGHVYSRYGNPTIEAVANKIAKLEAYGTNLDVYGMMVSSGMSAISTVAFSMLKSGDKILTQKNLYGGTTELFKKFMAKFGIATIWLDFDDLNKISDVVQKDHSIKMIYCESPANPTLSCINLAGIAKISKQANLWSVLDNTFCTPYIQQALNYGFDFIVHSTTKYLNGHGNSIAGVIVGSERKTYDSIWDGMKLLGTNCNAFDAWLVNNGMKTLALRMEKHSANALELAKYLESHSAVQSVNYPFLQSHKTYDIAKDQMKLGGGMLSFELKGGLKAGIEMMNKIRFCSLAPTLGDVDTLILHPATMSHRNVDSAVRYSQGITDGLIRLSVGIEDLDDIVFDLTQAMEK